jgi:hypothetical protein
VVASGHTDFVALRQPWGENRVWFLDEHERFLSLPLGWTDAGPEGCKRAVMVKR